MFMLWAALQTQEGNSGGPVWILASGIWNDDGQWLDGGVWNDG